MDKRWKDVVSYEEYFMVSNHGDIWSKRTNKLLKQTLNKNGYPCVASKIGGRKGKAICLKVHRVVAEVFLESPDKELTDWAEDSYYGVVQINHIDGNKENNHISNLEWCSGKENIQHALDNNLLPVRKGEECNNKLTEEDVIYIRKNYINRDKNFGCRALGRKFNVAHTIISRIVNNIYWKHI